MLFNKIVFKANVAELTLITAGLRVMIKFKTLIKIF